MQSVDHGAKQPSEFDINGSIKQPATTSDSDVPAIYEILPGRVALPSSGASITGKPLSDGEKFPNIPNQLTTSNPTGRWFRWKYFSVFDACRI